MSSDSSLVTPRPAERTRRGGRHSSLSFLMCRPTYYAIAYEINPWRPLNKPATRSRSLQQWHALSTLLTRCLHVRVQLLRPVKGLPDLVFTANAGLVHDRTLIRSNFRYPQRQHEEPIVEDYFRRRGMRIVTMPRRFNFEGAGDALFAGETLFLGFRFRSDAKAHEWLARQLRCRVLPLELADRRFYHLDTCFCPLSERSVLWYPKAFDRYGREVITSYFEDSIEVSTADARRFACNAIVLPHAVVLHAGTSSTLRRQLERRGFEVHGVDLSEFLKAGGAAKCLVLQVAG